MKRVSMPIPEGLKCGEVSDPPKNKLEDLKRTAYLARERALNTEALHYEIYERNAKSILQSFKDNPGNRLSIADMHSMRDHRKLAYDIADRADAEVKQAEGLPEDPRFTKLGVAVATGDLVQAWVLIYELAEQVLGHWITIKKGEEVVAGIKPEMPEALKEELRDPNPTPFNPAIMNELRLAQDRSDARAEVVGEGEGMLRLPDGRIVERPKFKLRE